MAFLWGILACAVVGAAAWWYGLNKGKNDVEVRALTLLTKISELIVEEDPAKARDIIKRYTSGEARIRDILIFENLEQ
jgi:hypothetical protein